MWELVEWTILVPFSQFALLKKKLKIRCVFFYYIKFPYLMSPVHNNLAHFSCLSANCFFVVRINPNFGLFLIIRNSTLSNNVPYYHIS